MKLASALAVASIAVAILAAAPFATRFGGADAFAFNVTNNGFSAYTIDGVDNPTLELTRGQTYFFFVDAAGHPFYIKTARTTGVGNQYTNGVEGNGESGGTITFTVPADAPATLFYQCGVHASMGGTFNVIDPLAVPDDARRNLAWLDPALPNPARNGSRFRFGLPRASNIDLSLFDVRGRRIVTLANRHEKAGTFSIEWNGRDAKGAIVPSGVYLLRLMVDGRPLHGRLSVAR